MNQKSYTSVSEFGWGRGYSWGAMNTERHKKSLLEMKRGLLRAQETGDQAEQTVELDQARVGRLSRMDAMQAQAMSKETGRRRRNTLLRIEAALRRIEEGDYGYCQECGENIAPARLDIDPSAQLCIQCASALEE
jgi:DnaK suppressor protein